MITTILFDLDGTLLPMDQDDYTRAYFQGLCHKARPHGYEPEALVKMIWSGTAAMVRNDGKETNEQAFWRVFAATYGEDSLKDMGMFDSFYEKEFQNIRVVCGYEPTVAPMIRAFKARGVRVVLATNPIFPRVATESRIRWAGLEPEDFELYTTYEKSRHCKPNPDYYRDILAEIGVPAEECIMVGNDVAEDMIAEQVGMKAFLLTNCLINKKEADISAYPHGGFAELWAHLDGMTK